jgi:hypothetical protein
MVRHATDRLMENLDESHQQIKHALEVFPGEETNQVVEKSGV